MTDEEVEFIGNWTYGKIYPYTAKILMQYIFDSLAKMDTIIKIKSADFKIKCFHTNPRKINKFPQLGTIRESAENNNPNKNYSDSDEEENNSPPV